MGHFLYCTLYIIWSCPVEKIQGQIFTLPTYIPHICHFLHQLENVDTCTACGASDKYEVCQPITFPHKSTPCKLTLLSKSFSEISIGEIFQFCWHSNTQIHKYKYTNTNTQTQIHKYINTNTQIQIHKFKYTNTKTEIKIHK